LIDGPHWRDWEDLDAEERLALREAYDRYLGGLPPTCHLEEKVERFRRWLAERQIGYRPRLLE
jgi:hypothetical protein